MRCNHQRSPPVHAATQKIFPNISASGQQGTAAHQKQHHGYMEINEAFHKLQLERGHVLERRLCRRTGISNTVHEEQSLRKAPVLSASRHPLEVLI